MHEVSIALSIIRIIEKELQNNPGKHLSHLRLQVGALSGVVPDSLLFALEASGSYGPLKNCEISIDTPKAMALCPECQTQFEAEDYFGVCPNCGNSRYDIVSGKDLLIKSITLVSTKNN